MIIIGNFYKTYTREEMGEIGKNQGFYFIETSNEDYFIIAKNDLADFIMQEANRCNHNVDISVYVPNYSKSEPILTTYGCFLNKCNPKLREEIIDRLIKLQTFEEKPKEVKIFDNHEFFEMKVSEFGEEEGKTIQYDKFFKQYYDEELEAE